MRSRRRPHCGNANGYFSVALWRLGVDKRQSAGNNVRLLSRN